MAIFQTSQSWVYCKAGKKHRDDRLAYRSIYDRYLGPNNVDYLVSNAERRLATKLYHDQKRNWNFDKYITLKKDQHNIFWRLVEHGYKVIGENSKVRFFIKGVKTTALNLVKTNIIIEEKLISDFPSCVTLYKYFEKKDNERKVRDQGGST